MMRRKDLKDNVDQNSAARKAVWAGESLLIRNFVRKSIASSSDGNSNNTGVEAVEIVIKHFLATRARVLDIPTTIVPDPALISQAIAARVGGPIAVVGAGNMGASLLDGWLGLGIDPKLFVVVEPNPTEHLLRIISHYQIPLVDSISRMPHSSVLFLAIKPQIADGALPHFEQLNLIGNDTLIISIMAGKTLTRIVEKIGRPVAVVRAMPNIVATIGRGITAAIHNDLAGQSHREVAHILLLATGGVEWIDDERLMDAVTAVSGSGPAYVFLLSEVLARAGTAAGLPVELADRLARETVAGTGEMLHRSNLDPARLRESVTSQGGTTDAALKVLMGEGGLESIMIKAVAAATKRSRELAG